MYNTYATDFWEYLPGIGQVVLRNPLIYMSSKISLMGYLLGNLLYTIPMELNFENNRQIPGTVSRATRFFS